MKSTAFSRKLSRLKYLYRPLVIRRIVGKSMHPTLRPGRLVIGLRFFLRLKPGAVVIIKHQGTEKIKRVKVSDERSYFVVGDNEPESTDSRHFGWVPRRQVLARVLTRR